MGVHRYRRQLEKDFDTHSHILNNSDPVLEYHFIVTTLNIASFICIHRMHHGRTISPGSVTDIIDPEGRN